LFKERPGVFGPEYEGVHILRQEAEAFDLVWVVRVDPVKVTGFDPVGEPLAVKSRQVRPSAGADDQGEPPEREKGKGKREKSKEKREKGKTPYQI
jgi:hypothetical protein